MTRLAVSAVEAWPAANRRFYDEFCRWLRQGGYSDATVYLYGRAARLALGWLDLDYRRLDPVTDLARVRRVMANHYRVGTTCQTYGKGLAKLAHYLRLRCGWPEPTRPVRWDYHLDRLPGWLAAEHCPERAEGCAPTFLSGRGTGCGRSAGGQPAPF